MTPAERKTKIDAIQQSVRVAGERHDGNLAEILSASIAKLTPPPTEPSTISPRPIKTTTRTPAKTRPPQRGR